MARLTPDQKEDVRLLHHHGYSESVLAEIYDVHPNTIWRVVQEPADPDVIEAARAERERLEAYRASGTAKLAGFVGPGAEMCAEIFGVDPDGGSVFRDPHGAART